MDERASPRAVRALRAALVDHLGREQVRDDPSTLEAHAGDWSGADPVLPDLVVRPGSTTEVATVLRLANEHRVPVTPRGLGSGKSGGAIPIRGGLVLSTARLDAIERVDPEDMVAEVGAGCVLGRLWEAVEGAGLFYPPDPNSFEMCSIGGNVACNAGGPRALKYGVTRNYVLGLEVVLPTGQILEVGKQTLKHVTGYDLTGLIVGSEGTLGVVTKAILRLLPKPAAVQTALVAFADVHQAARVVTGLLAEGHQPRTLELLDHHALDAVRRKTPEAFPRDAGALIIVETDGPDEERAFADLARLAEAALARGALDVQVAASEADRRRIWAPRNVLSESLKATAERKISEDIVVPRSRIPAMIEAAQRIADASGVRVATYGHAGDGNLHVNVLFARDQEAAAARAVLGVMEAAVALGGTLSGEHGVGLTKRDFLPLEHPPAKIALQRSLKRLLDPADILNPGKVLPPEGAPLPGLHQRPPPPAREQKR